MASNNDFFSDPKHASLAKITILRKYLRPFTYKLGSRPPRRVWLVDGFAGQGIYDPDEGGQAEDGSPAASAKLARELELSTVKQQLYMINVEADRDTFVRLIGNLAPYQHLCTNINKTFADALEEILDRIGRDPTLFFLDPFGVSGIEVQLLDRILERAGKKTELLIHFSDRSVLRMAGNLDDNEQRKEVGQKAADAKVARLDEMIGSPMWQGIWRNKSLSTEQRIDGIANLYRSVLCERGYEFAYPIRMRDEYSDRPKYRLVFCTHSPHGVELMSQFACDYERELFERHHDGSFDIMWNQDQRRVALTALQDEIYALGISRGEITQQQIVHELTPKHFADFLTAEYHEEIRRLVDVGSIDRLSRKGIKNNEALRFVVRPQQQLLGA